MIDSVVFIKLDIEDVINYYLSISDSERIVENENIIVDNLLFKEKNDWTYIINLEGDAFSEEFLLELSKERQLIYYYTDDSQLDSEFVVINCNKISRKRYIYTDTPELDEDEGKLTCENKELADWNDIDYLVDIIQENPDKLFE